MPYPILVAIWAECALSVMDRIRLLQSDITRLEVDAVVNAANQSLLGGGGVDGAIYRAAGPELLAECRTLNGCPTGKARITRGYRLPAKHVIHTVGSIYNGSAENAELPSDCYRNSLDLVPAYSLSSVAFPATSCGVYGCPVEEACDVALRTTSATLKRTPSPERVVFVLFSPKHYRVYSETLAAFSAC